MNAPKAVVRYAYATIESARSNSALDILYNDMLSIVDALESSKELVEFLQNPIITSKIKIKTLNSILPNLHKLSEALIGVASQNRRIEFLGDIANTIIEILDTESGKITTKITTAVELNKKLENDILNKLSAHHKGNITIENNIDTSILGGFIARIGDKEYDASISGSLNRLKTELL